MKYLLLLTCCFAGALHAQSGRSVIVSWNDTNVTTPANPPTYKVLRAPGLCTGTPTFAPIATGLTVKTYTDVNVAIGTYCYSATVTINGIESTPATPVSATVGPVAPTALSIVIP